MKKVLLQLTLTTDVNTLELGLAEEIKNEDREYIMATLELLGNKILLSMRETLLKKED